MTLKRIHRYMICIFVCFLGGCANTKTETPAQGLYYNVESVPSINEFADTQYEDYASHFAQIESAVFICNETEHSIEPNDPRLIRLLNFLAYSDEKSLSSLQQGYITEEQMNSFQLSEFPRLEVRFNCAEYKNQSSLSEIFKIVVCGDSYLRYSHAGSDNESVIVERYWPYGELVMSMVAEKELPMSVLSYEDWGTGYWIDLIKYAGFPYTIGDGLREP